MAAAVPDGRVIGDLNVDKYTDAPWIATVRKIIPAPAGDVWSTLVEEERMRDWASMVRRVEFDNSNSAVPGEIGSGSVRIFTLVGGLRTLELIQLWEPPHRFAYTTFGIPLVRGQLGIFEVESLNDRSAAFTIHQFVHVPRPLRPLLRAILERLANRFVGLFEANGSTG